MSADLHDAPKTPLIGPGGRIPSVDAVRIQRTSGVAALRAAWSPLHTASMVVVTPLALWAYRSALDPSFNHPAWWLVLGAMALAAALIVTTYIPERDTRTPAAPCAAMGFLLVPAAAMLLDGAAGPQSAILPLAILLLGVWQRLSGASACG